VLCCVQVVEEVFDPTAAEVMGIGQKGTVCVMIHSGSRGLGHQVILQGIGWQLAAAVLTCRSREVSSAVTYSLLKQDTPACMPCLDYGCKALTSVMHVNE